MQIIDEGPLNDELKKLFFDSIKNGNKEEVWQLLEKNPKLINCVNKEMLSALNVATINNKLSMVRFLLKC